MAINQKAALEGLLFLAGDEGVSSNIIQEVLAIKEKELPIILEALKTSYAHEERGIEIQKFASKYRITTKKEYFYLYEDLFVDKQQKKLSVAAFETLAIVAFRGPITRQAIEKIRGVNCESMILKLKIRKLILENGKSDLPGKPMTYIISEEFLKILNIDSIEDLPKLQINEELKENLYD